jgi:16S rRNA (uracil1498-N3)-methyltransferase
MRAIRLFVDLPLVPPDRVMLPPAPAHRVRHVLRLAAGQPLTLFNGDGCDYAGAITRAGGKGVEVALHKGQEVATEAPWPLVLAQCLAKGSKMDLVVQKATELGATSIAPLLSERSAVRLDAAHAGKRRDHWRGVAISACEQCGRARLPLIEQPQRLEHWLADDPAEAALRLALVPGANRRVRDLAIPAAGVVLVIGPEGGLGARDRAALTDAGFTGVALGPRILRTETAGLAGLAAIQACHGEG